MKSFVVSRHLVTLVTASCLWGGILHAQATPASKAPEEETKTVELYLGHSQVVKAPWMVKRMSVTNPAIADVQALTPESILIMGKSIGTTDVFLWSETEERWQARIMVTADLGELTAVLAKILPGSDLKLTQSQEVVIVSGSLARAEQAVQLRDLLTVAELKYVDMTKLAGVQQVQLQVRVAEVSRRAIRALGVNAFHTGSDFFGGSTIGPAAGGPLNPISIGVPAGTPATPNIPFAFTQDVAVSPAVTLFGGFPDLDLEIFIQALAENQYLRLLAEPTLVALSGETANFLAGGEFPIPVVQGTTAGATSISIEYKEFGVRLGFNPTVLGDGTIRLKVTPEVSELSETGSVEIQGFNIPSVVTRRAETTLELKSGQSFTMAGLLSNSKTARSSRVPVLGDLPIIGPLFRSVRYEKGETELMVLVTAKLVEPLSVAQLPPGPGTLEVPETDWEIFLEGSIEGKKHLRTAQPGVFKATGLGRLKGPGAWVNHEGGNKKSGQKSASE